MPLLVLWPKKLLHPLSQMVSCHTQSFILPCSQMVMSYSCCFGRVVVTYLQLCKAGMAFWIVIKTRKGLAQIALFACDTKTEIMALWRILRLATCLWKSLYHWSWMLGHVHWVKDCMLYFMNLSASVSNITNHFDFIMLYNVCRVCQLKFQCIGEHEKATVRSQIICRLFRIGMPVISA